MGNGIESNQSLLSIQVGDKELKYKLTRSNRKTIGITIEKDGFIKVTSPYSVSINYINQLLIEKSSWIQKKIYEIESRKSNEKVPKLYQDGEVFLYLGTEYKLKINRNYTLKKPYVKLEARSILIDAPSSSTSEEVKKAIRLWYIQQFKQISSERIKLYSKSIDVFPKKVVIKEQKTRWGSCSSRGNINLNWKLIMSPIEILDYVIIHELCHLIEMNHSRKFWNAVVNFCPQYKNCRAWLKQNGNMLSLY